MNNMSVHGCSSSAEGGHQIKQLAGRAEAIHRGSWRRHCRNFQEKKNFEKNSSWTIAADGARERNALNRAKDRRGASARWFSGAKATHFISRRTWRAWPELRRQVARQADGLAGDTVLGAHGLGRLENRHLRQQGRRVDTEKDGGKDGPRTSGAGQGNRHGWPWSRRPPAAPPMSRTEGGNQRHGQVRSPRRRPASTSSTADQRRRAGTASSSWRAPVPASTGCI